MVIEQSEGVSENKLAHVVAVQETVWEAHPKAGDRIEDGQLRVEQRHIQTAQILLELLDRPAPQDRNDVPWLLPDPGDRDLRGRSPKLAREPGDRCACRPL